MSEAKSYELPKRKNKNALIVILVLAVVGFMFVVQKVMPSIENSTACANLANKIYFLEQGNSAAIDFYNINNDGPTTLVGLQKLVEIMPTFSEIEASNEINTYRDQLAGAYTAYFTEFGNYLSGNETGGLETSRAALEVVVKDIVTVCPDVTISD